MPWSSSTTVLNAAVMPLATRYIEELVKALRAGMHRGKSRGNMGAIAGSAVAKSSLSRLADIPKLRNLPD